VRGEIEEPGFAYEHFDAVVDVLEQTGLSHRVATLSPIGNIKG
jgi:RNA-splicing ligase RtcB